MSTRRTSLASLAILFLAVGCSASGSGSNVSTPPPTDAGLYGDMDVMLPPPDVQSEALKDTNLPDEGAYFEVPPCANDDLTGDLDGDGWSVEDGDCNDCTPLMNPGAYDFPWGHVDEDCNGIKDEPANECDKDLAPQGTDPMDAARSMGLCKTAVAGATGKDKTWGVVSAKYVFADGSSSSQLPITFPPNCIGSAGEGTGPNALSYAVVQRFGDVVKPQGGQSMVVLSSGIASESATPPSPSGARMCTKSGMPPGFPTPSSQCPQNTGQNNDALDSVALELTIRTPTNAKSFSYDFDFYTYEAPDWVCKDYNDYFVALLWAQGASGTNISLDANNNPVSVNNAFLEVCREGDFNGVHYSCPLGVAELAGTGFEERGATGWLRTTVPITPGEEIKLRFAIWDSNDDIYDASVLLDNFVWEFEALPKETERPPK